jgi:hypothetical protein
MNNIQVLAFHVQRRAVGLAAFNGIHLEHASVRQLSSKSLEAEKSVIEFARRSIAQFNPGSVALNIADQKDGGRSKMFKHALIQSLRTDGIPIWEVSTDELLKSFGEPELASRHDLHQASVAIWPDLNSFRPSKPVLHAAATGLYVQSERLLALASEGE